MHEFRDVIAFEQIGGKKLPYRRRELHFLFKGEYLMYGWCHADHLSGLWEPDKPWGTYEK